MEVGASNIISMEASVAVGGSFLGSKWNKSNNVKDPAAEGGSCHRLDFVASVGNIFV